MNMKLPDGTILVFVFELVRVGDLRVDHTYQRPCDGREKGMADSFERHRIGVPCVSRRRDGSMWIIDGQHRIAAMRLLGLDDEQVMVEMYHGLTLQQEAHLFNKKNEGAKRVHALDRFRAELVERDPVALDIQSILAKQSLSIAAGRSNHTLACIAAVKTCHLKYRNLARVVSVLRSWGSHVERWDGQIVKWLGLFINKYPQLDDVRLIRALNKSMSPLEFRSDVRATSRLVSGSKNSLAVAMLRDAYNKGLRTSSRLGADE